jgi:hypothetical protein
MNNKFTSLEFWYWVYWMRVKEVGLLKLSTQAIELKKLGVRKLNLN